MSRGSFVWFLTEMSHYKFALLNFLAWFPKKRKMEIEVSVNDMSPAHRASVLGDREELIRILEVKNDSI